MAQVRLVSGIVTVGGVTLISRVFGFARDIAFAATLGSGPVAEAFLTALSLPNLFRRFFAEGAFNLAFVPMFARKLEGGDDAADFAANAMSGLALLVSAVMALAMLAMPWLVWAMASGFQGDMRFGLAVEFSRITFPYILMISLTALLSGILNATGRFAAAAFAPVVLNLGLLTAMGLALWLGWPVGPALAWSVPLAGVAQLALVWWAAARAGYPLKPRRPRLTADLRRLALIAAPAMLAGGVSQINLLVGRQVASFFDGAVAWLSYADRLYQLPLGVVGVAIAVVLLPDLSRRLRNGDAAGGRASLNRAAEFGLALTIPAAVALMVIATPLVEVLFQRGAFGPRDTAATALSVACYAAGLPALVLHKVLQPLFYAREDTVRPFRYALVCLFVNAGLAVALVPVAGFLAAPIGMSVAAWVMVALLWHGAQSMGPETRVDGRFRQRVPRMVLAAGIMGLVLAGGATLLAGPLHSPHLRYGALALLVSGGIATYFGCGAALGAFVLADFRRALRRG